MRNRTRDSQIKEVIKNVTPQNWFNNDVIESRISHTWKKKNEEMVPKRKKALRTMLQNLRVLY